MDRQDLIAAPRRLDTPRLRLEAPRVEHAAAFVDSLLRTLPALRFVGWGQQARDLAWSEQFCRRGAELFDTGECVIFNAFHRDSGAYVGRVDLHSFDFEAPRGEVGYVVDEAHAGQGLMREAVLAVMALGFSLGLARIQALSDARNTRALVFAERLGLQREGLLKGYERDAQGALCDMVMFAALAPRHPMPGG
ncbi:MAG: GNAT family N-acetyltransferase [Burkholderiales bacterium]|nr:GNAT family N-acetyltransferase [Burkholderiales bacterium]